MTSLRTALRASGASQPCSWAACRETGTSIAGDWWFCDHHARQHEAIEAGDDPDGEDIPDELLHPRANGHGTPARYQMHLRDGEKSRACPVPTRTATTERSDA